MKEKGKWKLVAIKSKKQLKKELELENLKNVDTYLKQFNVTCMKSLE